MGRRRDNVDREDVETDRVACGCGIEKMAGVTAAKNAPVGPLDEGIGGLIDER